MSPPFEDVLGGLYSAPLPNFGFLIFFNGLGDPTPPAPGVKTPFKKLFVLANFLTVFLNIIGK
jgi:hypothetical protein